MTEYAHLHPDFRHVMALSDQERIAFIHQPRWIGYPAANQILATLNELIKEAAPKAQDDKFASGW